MARTQSVNGRYLPMLVLLSLIWGSSFMFIKVADRQLDPATLILGRIALAAVTLAIYVAASIGGRAALRELREHWLPLVVVGLLNTAIPFWLLSWGETRIDSGTASIIQASVPIFTVLLAYGFFHEQRVTGSRLVGVAVGFVGVALLVGAQPAGKILGAVAVVGMAVCYAAGGLLIRRYLSAARPAVAAIAVLPAGVIRAPSTVPDAKTIGSVVFLGIVGTAFAYLLFFTIIAGAGASYASFVTYLVPPVALAYGAIFLGEGVGGAAVAGLMLILGGVALGTGLSRRPWRRASTVPEPTFAAAPSEPS